MAKENNNVPPVDETGYIDTAELRDVLKSKEEKPKKESWFKRVFKKKKPQEKK